MPVLVLSRSSSFARHLSAALSNDNELVFYSSLDDITKRTLSGVSAVLIHSPSFVGEVETMVSRLNQLFASSGATCAIGIAADYPLMEEMLLLSGSTSRAYFNSYMADVHYRQMLQFLTSGQHWYVPGLLESALHIAKSGMPRRAPMGVLAGLTPREKEIAQVLSTGLNNKEIAKRCGITERTVKAHLTNIFEKCGVRDRISLAILVNTSTHKS